MRQRETLMGGDRLEDKYGIEREIGRGSIGIVYSAWHLGLDRRVAIKVLRPELASDEEAIARLQVPAKAVAALSSECALKVFDVGRLPSGAPYIVMELLDGENLEDLVLREGARDPIEAIDLVLAACEPIEEAHRLGILHRAIEPKNLWAPLSPTVTPVKVTDFGLTKRSRSAFHAPEHFSGTKIDARADIWSLGATLHFLVAGRAPFDPTFQASTAQDPPRLRTHRPDAPEPLERLIAKCMQRSPRDRYRTIKELVRTLKDVKRELLALPESDPIPAVAVRSTLRIRVGEPAAIFVARESAPAFDPMTARRSLVGLTAICSLLVLLGMIAGATLGLHAIAAGKRVAVSTSTSSSLFARR